MTTNRSQLEKTGDEYDGNKIAEIAKNTKRSPSWKDETADKTGKFIFTYYYSVQDADGSGYYHDKTSSYTYKVDKDTITNSVF